MSSSSNFLKVINSSSVAGVSFVGVTGPMGSIGSTGPAGVIPTVFTNSTQFNSNCSVLGKANLNQISGSINTGTSIAIDGSSNLKLDYNVSSIFIVNASATQGNINLYISNLPAVLDKTYTVTLIVNKPICANVFYLNHTDSVIGNFVSKPALCNGGLSNVVIPASSTYVTQKISIVKSSDTVNIGNVVITEIIPLR